MHELWRGKRGVIRHGRWLLPVLVLVVALAGMPAGPVRDGDRALLYRGGSDAPLPTAEIVDPTVTPTPERVLLEMDEPVDTPPANTPEPTVTPVPFDPTVTPDAVQVGLTDAMRQRAQGRADAIYGAIWEHFYVEDDLLFRETAPDEHTYPYSYLWPLSQTLGASNDMASLPDSDPQYVFDVLSITGAIEHYYDDQKQPPAYSSYIPPPWGHANDRFYDDNAWIGLELLRAYQLTGYELARERAGQIFDYLVSGWDTSEDGPNPGGVFWVEAWWSRDRNTVSTAPAAKLGLLLAEQEENPQRRRYLLNWSKTMYDWVETNMRGPDGLYWDRVTEDGRIDEVVFTYNQGAMLGASLLLYRATGNERYLARAEEIGQAAIARWNIDGLLAQPAAFNALLFTDLLLLNDVRPDQRYLDLLVEYSDRIWLLQRNPTTHLVTTTSPTTLLDQSATARIYAMLAGYGAESQE
jgi:hypothetical protein